GGCPLGGGNGRRRRWRADPWETRRVEVRLRRLQQRCAYEGARHESPGGAVLRRNAVDEMRRLDAARTRHVPDHDRWVARNVPGDGLRDGAWVTRQRAR